MGSPASRRVLALEVVPSEIMREENVSTALSDLNVERSAPLVEIHREILDAGNKRAEGSLHSLEVFFGPLHAGERNGAMSSRAPRFTDVGRRSCRAHGHTWVEIIVRQPDSSLRPRSMALYSAPARRGSKGVNG